MPWTHSFEQTGEYPFRPVFGFSHSRGKMSSRPRKRLRKRATFSSAVEGILDGKGRPPGGTGLGGVEAESSTASRPLSSWSFASASARSFSIRASLASTTAIIRRRESRSDMGQRISFSASSGERTLIPLTGGKRLGFEVMIAHALPAIAAAKKMSSEGSGDISAEYKGWTITQPRRNEAIRFPVCAARILRRLSTSLYSSRISSVRTRSEERVLRSSHRSSRRREGLSNLASSFRAEEKKAWIPLMRTIVSRTKRDRLPRREGDNSRLALSCAGLAP